MTNPELVEVHPYNVTIKWSELTNYTNGGDMPIFYELQWYNYETLAWEPLTFKATHGKILQFTHVRSGSFYEPTSTLKYRLRAENGVGMGTAYSNILVLNPDTAPTGMDPLSLVLCEPYNITISWPELSPELNGGDPPIYYEVEWYDPSSLNWVKMINDETQGKKYSFIHLKTTTYFTPDTYMKYRVTPKN